MECSETLYHGCRRIDFVCNGYPSLIVLPDSPAEGKPWVWRAEFFGGTDSADVALLKLGWHICYHKVSDQYGAPGAIKSMKVFHDEVVSRYGLARDAVPFGFSRGGLYAFNYACAYPQDVRALYLDAPVLDIRSWPGSKYAANKSDPRLWQDCLRCYGITEAELDGFTGSPIDHAAEPARNGIPLLMVAGASDTDVPYFENGARLARLYAQAGGDVKVILKPGCAHHPHSLEDPAPIVDWILARHRARPAQFEAKEWTSTWYDEAPRKDVPRAMIVGDSIANSYRNTVNDALGDHMRADTLATSKAIDNPFLIDELSVFVRQAPRPYSQVHFNNGLHGWHLSLEEYERNYERVLDALVAMCPGARFTLALSTPVWKSADVHSFDTEKNGIILARNDIVRKIAARRAMPVDDLYATVEAAPEFRQPDGFHYNAAGTVYLGGTVAKALLL